MLGYRCNLQGCCCKGWQIGFSGTDLARLADHLPADELQSSIARGLVCVVDEGVVDHFRLKFRELEPGQAGCRFLDAGGACELHERFGVAALPGLCVDFPVVAAALGDSLELSFSPLCPAVLDALAAADGPYELAAVAAEAPLAGRRLERIRPVAGITLGGVELEAPALRGLRDKLMAGLRAVRRPPLEHLQAISYGLSFVLHTADVQAFELRYDMPPLPFVRFFHQAMATHSGAWLGRSLRSYRRFVFEPRVAALIDSLGDRIDDELDGWEEDLAERLAPVDGPLAPLLNRFMAHRYFSAYVAFRGEVLLALGRVAHTVALALRVAVVAARCLQTDIDLPLLKVALGASAYLHHNDALPPDAAVWFVPGHFEGI